ncbi:hypothetical protein [Microvirga terricola]|uniref:Uncharacterized protein n=1 Tax=Microvirga terricola TaxID=2719797 RepID=A0ABX0VC98_9HYPH|nr:hypothetical protein [Microvirga terricola]NIX76320.1 hypothetical protein [Microvirga terricola]
MTADKSAGQFGRLHQLFTFHLGVAVTLSWLTALYAASYAPWVRNIRPLIDPSYVGQPESTWSFLFAFPLVLSVAWIMSFSGREILRHIKMLKNQTIEFGIAGAVAFALFYLSIDRAVAALLIGS